MRILRISIDGYGRFAAASLAFEPGLTIVMGPNERGKSTIRSFIADMLYGQKSNANPQHYDEANQLRVPWENPDCYGGSLAYLLDDGREIEVIRNFDRKREAIQIFNRSHGREITGDFDRLKNREIDFAATHLGVGKEVFLGAATISHFSLEDLGDKDALNQIRQKLLSLADSGDEEHSAEAALSLLQERIDAIGPASARNKPLPRLRLRLSEVERELDTAKKLQESLADLGEERRLVLLEIDALRERRITVEEDLHRLKAHEQAARLREAEALLTRIDTATQHCFALSAARDFPLEQLPDVQRAENLVNTAKVQLARSKAEMESLQREQDAQESAAAGALTDLPEAMETRLIDLSATGQSLAERIEETENHLSETTELLNEVQERVANLPDFSRLSPDPVEWLTQLGSSFSMAMRSRQEECEVRDKLRQEVMKREEAIAQAEALFADMKDFPEQARDYELKTCMHEEEVARRRHFLHSLEGKQAEMRERSPAFIGLTTLCSAGLIALLVTFYLLHNPALLVAVLVLGCSTLYFLGSLFYARVRLGHYISQHAETQAELDAIDDQQRQEKHPVEELLKNSGAQNIRELEAVYDQYRSASADLAARMGVFQEQQERALENEERVPKLVARFRETFATVGESIESEEDIPKAVGNAISRYQAYREAKGRLGDYRSLLQKQEAEKKRLYEAQAQSLEVLEAVERDMRTLMQEQGFDHTSFESGQEALRAYHNAQLQQQDKRGRSEILKEKLAALRIRLREEKDLHRCERDMERYIQAAKVNSVEQWHRMADQAREYQQVWEKRTALEEQLDSLLHNEEINDLRQIVEANGALTEEPTRSREELKEQLEELSARIDNLMEEEHQLHIEMTQRAGGMRSLNEIEEEQAFVAQQLQSLEEEFDATTYAMARIEDIARDKHARIAPKLASAASEYLSEITQGRYDELMLSRDLKISIRIPQTDILHENPEKSLSKGTVDQIYLALRLALVQGMSENGEAVPMLLDDPFSNYDDHRLERTLRLIQRMTQKSQVLIFTCREDVVRAANAVKAPVIRL